MPDSFSMLHHLATIHHIIRLLQYEVSWLYKAVTSDSYLMVLGFWLFTVGDTGIGSFSV